MEVAYYVMYFVLPIGALVSVLIVVKFCCKIFYCMDNYTESFDSQQHPSGSIYVIPISAYEAEYDASDEGSEGPVEATAPPPYDSLDPPPLYSQWKLTLPKEDPPAYTELEFTSSAAEHSRFASSGAVLQQTF